MSFFFACLKGQSDKGEEIKGNKVSVQTREEKIIANIQAANISFHDALPKAEKDISEGLKKLREEFKALQVKIAEAQKKPNFDPYKFAIAIFTIKESKCEEQLNLLYHTALNARNKVEEQNSYLPKESKESEKFATQVEEMDKKLDDQCKNPIATFAKEIKNYAEAIGIKVGHSAFLEPEDLKEDTGPNP